MKLSVILVHYKNWQKLDVCVSALQKYSIPKSEIIIVDNNSENKNEEEKFLQKWEKSIAYIPSSVNLGFAKAVNLASKNAKGEYLLILNPDVRIKENSLEEAMDYLDKNKTVGILGGKLIYPSGEIQDSYRCFPRLTDQIIKRVGFLRQMGILRKHVSKYLMWEKDPNKSEPVDWVVGAFMFIRRKAFDEINGFDERYFLFMEDVDICRKMWEKGYTIIYNPKAEAMHDEIRLSPGSILDIFKSRLLQIHFKSALKYFWKYKFKKTPHVKPK